MVRKIGFDPGFGGIKIAEVQWGGTTSPISPPQRGGAGGGESSPIEPTLTTYTLPSTIGIGSVDVGALNLAGVVRAGRRGPRPHHIVLDGAAETFGAEYLVGHGVAQHARPIERMDFARFTEGPELRALFYAALYQVLDGGHHQVVLAIGLPVEILQDKALATQTERDMARWLVGRHQFTLDGVDAHFEVTGLRAKVAQPIATWFDWGLDLNGQWIRGPAAAKAPCLIVDQGFNTLDLLVVEGGQISTRYTSGDTLGMRRAAEIAARNVQHRHGVELSLHEADDLVQAVVQGRRRAANIYVQGRLTDVSGDVRQAVNAIGADVVSFVERSVGKGKKFRILLTGGGALALAPRLLRQYDHARVVDDPVLANARGLAKLAVRPGFLD